MTGLNKYDQKEKRKQRLRNHVARDLASPKYRQRVVPAASQKVRNDRKRIDNDDGSYYFRDEYEGEE